MMVHAPRPFRFRRWCTLRQDVGRRALTVGRVHGVPFVGRNLIKAPSELNPRWHCRRLSKLQAVATDEIYSDLRLTSHARTARYCSKDAVDEEDLQYTISCWSETWRNHPSFLLKCAVLLSFSDEDPTQWARQERLVSPSLSPPKCRPCPLQYTLPRRPRP